MRKIILFLFLFLLLVLQLTIMPRLAVFGVSANILIAAVLTFAVLQNGKSILFFSLLAGLLLDLFSGLPFGVYALSLVFLTWLILFAGKNFFKATDFSGQIPLIVCASLAYSLLSLFMLKIFYWFGLGPDISFWTNLARIGLIEAGLNAVFIFIFLVMFKKLYGLLARI